MKLLLDVNVFMDIILTRAQTSPLPDFEDNIQLFSAQQVSANYIITRNKRDFAQADISVVSPDEFLKAVARSSVS